VSRLLAIPFICALLLSGSSQNGTAAGASPAAGALVAKYELTLAGVSFGEFHLTAVIRGSRYHLQAKAEFSILRGLVYRGGGQTRSAGKLTKTGPEPLIFEVSYAGGDKKEKRRMAFSNGAVSQYSIVPAKRPNPRRVPLTEDQLKDVLDPLSAAFLAVQSDLPPGNIGICDGTAHVFDGQQRFDITLRPKRTDTFLRSAPSNLSGPVAVCRVKFVPIGGYRPDNPGIKFMTETDDVEAWLTPVPNTRLYLPYRIIVPTPLGPGSATLTEVKMRPLQ